MAQLKRWTPIGFIFGVLTLLFLLPYLSLHSRSEASASTRGTATATSTSTLQGLVLDAVDGKTVATAWIDTVDSNGHKTSQAVTSANGLTWTILSGTAQISEDALTGRTVFVPSGNQPVVAQPVVGGQAGAPVTIGLSSNIIPTNEKELTGAGGGNCRCAQSQNSVVTSGVDVRSVIDASVIPLSSTERVVRFQRTEYYAWDPDSGPMRITMNPDKVSEVHLTSLQPAGSPSFFPASAEAHMYFIIEMLNTGVRIFNPDPMVLRNSSTNWPPFQEPMINDTPVSFVLVDNPLVETMRIVNQEMYIYPTQELAIDLLSQQVTGGVLEASYRIRNVSSTGGDVRWFFLGDVGTPLTSTRGQQTIPAGGQALVTLRTQLQGSGLTQTLTLGAVTQSGTRLTGARRLQFHYPSITGAQPTATMP
jgi:hypothetical protein